MIGEFILIGVWILSFLLARLLYSTLSVLVESSLPQTFLTSYLAEHLNFITLGLLFFVFLIIGGIVSKFIMFSLPGSIFPWIGRVLGALLGLVKAAVIVILALKVGAYFNLDQSQAYLESQLTYLFTEQLYWLNAAVNHGIDSLLKVSPLTD